MVMEGIEHNAAAWQGMVLPVYLDNSTALACFCKGRSKNKHINQIVRASLFTCALYDITPLFHWVPTKGNTVADALSRPGYWGGVGLALTYFVWPDTGATLSIAELTGVHSNQSAVAASITSLLPDHLNADREHFQGKAYAKSSGVTWGSGWKAWEEFCAEIPLDPLAPLDDDDNSV